jgi:hypothetical protein
MVCPTQAAHDTHASTQVDDLLAQLKLELGTLGTLGASPLPFLTVMSRFGRYSLANQS